MVDGESVVNEMAFSYDGFNLMTTDVQSHSGGIAYDGAGNMTSLRPGGTDGDDWDENRTLTWDAWNRLVAVADEEETVVATYAYDALTRRIVRTVGAEDPVHTYWSNQWKPLEERVGADTDPERQYVWGARPGHRDVLILRDRDRTGDGTLDERLYATMDYFNATGALDADGDVVERYAYSAFGVRRVMAPDFTPRSASTVDWVFAFQGQFRDAETGYYNYGYRYYLPVLGHWPSRDPIHEEGGMNLYLFANNSGCNDLDYLGLTALTAEDTFKVVNVPPRPGALGEAWASQWYLILDTKVSTCPEGFMALDIASAAATISTFDSGNKGTKVHESAHIRDWRDVWTSIFGIVRSFANGGCLCAETVVCLKTEGIVDDLLSLGISIVKVRGAKLHAIGDYSPDGQWIAPNHKDQRQAFLDLYYKGVNQNTKDMNQIVKKISNCYKAGYKK